MRQRARCEPRTTQGKLNTNQLVMAAFNKGGSLILEKTNMAKWAHCQLLLTPCPRVGASAEEHRHTHGFGGFCVWGPLGCPLLAGEWGHTKERGCRAPIRCTKRNRGVLQQPSPYSQLQSQDPRPDGRPSPCPGVGDCRWSRPRLMTVLLTHICVFLFCVPTILLPIQLSACGF